ncbi:hypothetical protein EOD39_10737 [Acipenser ruthenus]|uniref:Uncharacterized protein n=1 Tax=Acipenser ruthenus TaxID=7906 RepID=A0A662YTA0_ACIRT|nr:hypothetical protein EOD39_10737 [Acipenser ruthenus]
MGKLQQSRLKITGRNDSTQKNAFEFAVTTIEPDFSALPSKKEAMYLTDSHTGPGSDAKELPHYCQHFSPWTSHAPHN